MKKGTEKSSKDDSKTMTAANKKGFFSSSFLYADCEHSQVFSCKLTISR